MREIILIIIFIVVLPSLYVMQKTLPLPTARIYAVSEITEGGITKKLIYDSCIKYDDREDTLDEVVNKKLTENNIDPEKAKVEISQPCNWYSF